MFTADRRWGGLALLFVVSVALNGQTESKGNEPADGRGLLGLKVICVDRLAGDESLAATAQEIAIAGLFAAKRFTITESCENSDAVLKGAVLERGEKRVRGEGEATDFGVAAGGASVGRSGGSAGFGAAVGGSGETLYSAETRSRVTVTLRLTDRRGTVLWAYSQDSAGGKSKGPVADAVERAIRQLNRELEKAGRSAEATKEK